MWIIGQHTGHQDPERCNLLVHDQLWTMAGANNVDDSNHPETGSFCQETKQTKQYPGKKWASIFFSDPSIGSCA